MKKLLLLFSLVAFKANSGDEIRRIAAETVTQTIALVASGISPMEAMNIADAAAAVKLLDLTRSSASIVSNNATLGLGLIGASVIGYAGYRYIRSQCSLDFMVDDKNKVVAISVTPESIRDAIRGHNINNSSDPISINEMESIRIQVAALNTNIHLRKENYSPLRISSDNEPLDD